MRRKNTKKPFQNTVPAKCTEGLSRECGSTGRRLKGLHSEDIALNKFKALGYSLRAKRQKFIGVEVDLLFSKSNELHIVEVKSYREGFEMISSIQLRRLKRVAQFLGSRHRSSVRLHLVSVMPNGVAEIHWDIGDEV